MPGVLLDTLKGEKPRTPPMWLMRQAGRYLPEYRELRSAKGGFLDLVYDSEAAAEITIQPLRRFGFDGAILFSDILIVPHAMGQKLEFLTGEGPRLTPKLLDCRIESFKPNFEIFESIYETVRLCRAKIDNGVTMLGFAGSPWTVATYMVNGEGSRDQHATRELAYKEPDVFSLIIDQITTASIQYLRGQIDAGAEVVQLFDSWAGSLSPDQFDRWVINPNMAITKALKDSHPDIPVIGFPKGAGAKLLDYARETGVDAVGLDETVDPVWANKELPIGMPVQGNLDPLMLMAGGKVLIDRIEFIVDTFSKRPHIFNLGHGIGQFTPIKHVEQLVSAVRGK